MGIRIVRNHAWSFVAVICLMGNTFAGVSFYGGLAIPQQEFAADERYGVFRCLVPAGGD